MASCRSLPFSSIILRRGLTLRLGKNQGPVRLRGLATKNNITRSAGCSLPSQFRRREPWRIDAAQAYRHTVSVRNLRRCWAVTFVRFPQQPPAARPVFCRAKSLHSASSPCSCRRATRALRDAPKSRQTSVMASASGKAWQRKRRRSFHDRIRLPRHPHRMPTQGEKV
jgi:hypothetical protein